MATQKCEKDSETLEWLRTSNADAFVVVAYGQILSQAILDMPHIGCINVHGSVLPKYRGAAPIQWCLHNGDRETGITTMLMDAGMDTGPMLLKSLTPIGLLENFYELAGRLANVGADLLIETLVKLHQQSIQPVPQDNAQATYAPLLKKEDYWLDWTKSAIALHNHIRGFFPNCSAVFRGDALKITATAPIHPSYWRDLPPEFHIFEKDWPALSQTVSQPGEIVDVYKGLGPIVKTGDGFLLLREVQLAGKRPQSGWDFANGMRLTAGEVLANGA